MSLINDALKKAQKQRTGEMPTLHSMPSVGGESAQHIARRSKPAGLNTLLVRAGIAGGVALLIGIGAYVALREKPSTGGPVSPPAASGSVGSPLAGGPSVGSTQPSAISPQPSSSQPSAGPAAQAPVAFTLKTEPAVQKPESGKLKPESQSVASSATPQPSAISPQPSVSAHPSLAPVASAKGDAISPPPPVAKPAAKLEPRAIEYIENLKVAGIRASATDPKVLMNDRVYRPGSVVNAEMSLKLAEITANSLTFEDDHGGRYTRTF